MNARKRRKIAKWAASAYGFDVDDLLKGEPRRKVRSTELGRRVYHKARNSVRWCYER